MKCENLKTAVCRKCGKTYHVALRHFQRGDNTTIICPDCGTREALESIGVGERNEQQAILETIHRCQANSE